MEFKYGTYNKDLKLVLEYIPVFSYHGSMSALRRQGRVKTWLQWLWSHSKIAYNSDLSLKYSAFMSIPVKLFSVGRGKIKE